MCVTSAAVPPPQPHQGLTLGTLKTLTALRAPLHVDVYVTKSNPEIDASLPILTDVLDEFIRTSAGKFTYSLVDVTSDATRQRAKEVQLEAFQLGPPTTEGTSYYGMAFEYRGKKSAIPQIHPAGIADIEFWITNKLRSLRADADGAVIRVGVVTGKDEIKLNDSHLIPRTAGAAGASMMSIFAGVFPYYRFVDVDVAHGADIDPTLDALIVTQPRKSYSDEELRAIDRFLLLGGKALSVFASAVTMQAGDATMKAVLDLHNLDKLVAGYGIKIEKDVVLDYASPLWISLVTAAGPARFRYPGISRVTADPLADEAERPLDTTFAGFVGLSPILLPFPSSLELSSGRQPEGVVVRAVLRTSLGAHAIVESPVDLSFGARVRPEPPFEQFAIAAIAEGKLQSAFPTKPNRSGSTGGVAPTPSRVLVVSSGEFFVNPFAYSGNRSDERKSFPMLPPGAVDPLTVAGPYANEYLTQTTLTFKNVLDWMTGGADLTDTSAVLVRRKAGLLR